MRNTEFNKEDYTKTIKKLLKKQVKTIEDAREFEKTYNVKVKVRKRLGKDTFGLRVNKNKSFNLETDIKTISVTVETEDYDYMLSVFGGDTITNRRKFATYLRKIIKEEINSFKNRDIINKKFNELFKEVCNLEFEPTKEEKIMKEVSELYLPELDREGDAIYNEIDDEEDNQDYGW